MIGERAFSGCGIASVKISASVRKVCDEAFLGCRLLRDVEFAAGSRLKTVGALAFGETLLREGRVRFPDGARVSENVFD